MRRFIFDLRDMSLSDSTALRALLGILEDLAARGIAVCIVGPPKGLLVLMPHARVSKRLRKVRCAAPARRVRGRARAGACAAGDARTLVC